MEIASVIPACAPAGTAAAISEPVPKNSEEMTEIANKTVKIQLITTINPSRNVQYADN